MIGAHFPVNLQGPTYHQQYKCTPQLPQWAAIWTIFSLLWQWHHLELSQHYLALMQLNERLLKEPSL